MTVAVTFSCSRLEMKAMCDDCFELRGDLGELFRTRSTVRLQMQLKRTVISTTHFNRAYLLRVWEGRSELEGYERFGLAQFIYLTIAGHLEAMMAELISTRVTSILGCTYGLSDAYHDANEVGSTSAGPVYDSLVSILKYFSRQSGTASLDKLIELLQGAFGIKLSEFLGDLHADLKALATLRNIFAHGRSLELSFDGEASVGTLQQSPLLLPAQRLLAGGVFRSLDFDAWSYPDFQATFYSDESIRYFHGKAQEIEMRLKGLLSYPPETGMPLMVRLPDLP